jgi:hypothetical protein
MDVVDAPTPIEPPLPKPVRRMLFKPVLPGRRNRPPQISSAQVSTLPTSDSASVEPPLSTNVPIVVDDDGHSKEKDELEVTSSRAQDVVVLPQEKPPTSLGGGPRLLLPSKRLNSEQPTSSSSSSLPPRHRRDAAQKADVLHRQLLEGTVTGLRVRRPPSHIQNVNNIMAELDSEDTAGQFGKP